MIRVAFVACCSLVTALGPLPLCCCQARHGFNAVEAPQCCGHKVVHQMPKPEASNSAPQHDRTNCPCGRHRSNFVAVHAGSQAEADPQWISRWMPNGGIPLLTELESQRVLQVAQREDVCRSVGQSVRPSEIMRC